MSIEQALAENTSALRELIAALKAGVPTTATQVAAVAQEAPAERTFPEGTDKRTPEEVSDDIKAENKAKKAAPKKTEEPVVGATKQETPTYQDTADAITRLARTKGRDAAVAVLAKFGASKLPDVKPEQFADVIAQCEAGEAVEA